MAKANPKAWFPGWTARISYKAVDKYARMQERLKPFFPTWGEAHDYMLKRASERLQKAAAEYQSAAKHLEKVKAMTEPVGAKAGEDA